MVVLDRARLGVEINRELDGLTLEQKVGQLIMVGFPGTGVTREVAEMITQCHLGGVMLGGGNIDSPAQVATLAHDLQRLVSRGEPRPLLTSIDQEGGIVNRLRNLATVMPSAMALGATRSVAAVEECTEITAHEMVAMGINVNFAPVLDVNSEPANPVIGVRSFGDAPAMVTDMGLAVVRTLRAAGIAATAKHFPGHGGATVDSHHRLPIIRRDRESLDAVDMVPFRQAIAAGVDMVMSAHAVYPALVRGDQPATLSPEIMTGLLRERLGFGGVVITDALVMKAIAEHHGVSEAAKLALRAGADVVLTLSTLEGQTLVFRDLVEAVKSGEIPLSMVDAAVARVLELKRRLRESGRASCSERAAFGAWPLEGHQAVARSAARRASTLVKNAEGLLPLRLRSEQRLGLIEFACASFSPVEEKVAGEGSLRQLISSRHPNVGYLSVDAELDGITPALDSLVGDADALVVATRNAYIIKGQAAMVSRILEAGKPAVVLALRGPYDIASFPLVTTYVTTYGDAPLSLEAVVALLFGDYEPVGKLPVTIGGLFAFGHGLERF